MAKYDVVYSCGHEGVLDLRGKRKQREWKIRNAQFLLCPECLEAERDQARKLAIKEAEELGLPELKGSEKQVAWAITLRKDLIEEFNKSIQFNKKNNPDVPFKEALKQIDPEANFDDAPDVSIAEAFAHILDFILITKTSAKYYIDLRGQALEHIRLNWRDAFKNEKEQQEEELLAQLKAEATVFPDNKITESVVEITINEHVVTAAFKKDYDFIDLVKELGYSFDWSKRVWYRNINTLTGSARDRAAELGNKLLNSGYPILIMEQEVRENAINGVFEKENERMIIKGENNQLNIWWKGWDTDLYYAAKSLPKARWQKPFVCVDIAHYTEVEEFADLYDFTIHEDARQMIETYKQSLANAQIVTPIKVETSAQRKDGLAEILESSDEVLSDLLDD